MPTNAARANRFFLYALKDDRWTIVGPRNGHRASKSGGDQLCILERQTPTLFYRAYSPETKKEYHCIYILREGTWTESAVGALLDPRAQIVSRDSMVYVICPGAVDWSIHELKSLDYTELPIPVHRFTIPGEVTVGEVFVRNKDTFVITIVDKHSSVSFRSFAQVKDRLVVDDIPSPDDNLVISLRWTTDGTICVATNDKRTVRAYLLQCDKTWKLVAEATETTTALIGNCSFAFSTDGKPIVTWETYVRE
jgi:hypothetical protein